MSELARGFLFAALGCFLAAVAFGLQSLLLATASAPWLAFLGSALLVAHWITLWHDRRTARRADSKDPR